jgi:hypothetical protein
MRGRVSILHKATSQFAKLKRDNFSNVMNIEFSAVPIREQRSFRDKVWAQVIPLKLEIHLIDI